MASDEKRADEALLKQLEIQWNDHFQTRTQTWKALEITALMAVALVGIDWRIENPLVSVVVALLLAIVAVFGMQITIHHRNRVEVEKFKVIEALEARLGLADDCHGLPSEVHWWDVFLFWKSNTSLFILRMQFALLVFAVGYLAFRLLPR